MARLLADRSRRSNISSTAGARGGRSGRSERSLESALGQDADAIGASPVTSRGTDAPADAGHGPHPHCLQCHPSPAGIVYSYRATKYWPTCRSLWCRNPNRS